MGWGLLSAVAFAQAPQAPPPALEVVVVAERRLSETREGLARSLKDDGYLRVLSLGDRAWYWNRQLWKPGVMVHDEGFARIRGHAFVPLPMVTVRETPAGTRVYEATALTQGHRKVQAQRAAVASELEPWLRELRDGHWELARARRRVELQIALARLWFDGIGPDGTFLPEWDARRAALVARWRDTAPDEAGQWVRDDIEAFVDAEVQTSDHPFAPEEREGWFGGGG